MSSFPIGCNVILQNLVKGSQYNGKRGIVKSNYDTNNGGRQNVLLYDEHKVAGKIVAVKPDNMKLARDMVDSNSKPNKSGGKSLSNKKKRGQQRKATKSQSQPTASMDDFVTASLQAGPLGLTSEMNDRLAAKFVKDIQDGWHTATHSLATIMGTQGENGSLPFNMSFESSGILTSVLGFLRRCEDETLSEVMFGLESSGDPVKSPSLWIQILLKADTIEPSCRMEIAKNIGPLIRCMCNDTKRQLFKSNKHWKKGIMDFVYLVQHMLWKSFEEEKLNVIEEILQHDYLLRSLVQWEYWRKERPDLIKELTVGTCTQIALVAERASRLVIAKHPSEVLGLSGSRILGVLGTTPIVSKEYDPNCMVSFMVDNLRQSKHNRQMKELFGMIPILASGGDCVDKDVIKEVIDWGLNCKPDLERSIIICLISAIMIHVNTDIDDNRPNDTRTAFAIRLGFIDMYLNFIDKFREHFHVEVTDDDAFSFYENIGGVFQAIHRISLHHKSAKAIRSKRDGIEEKLVRLEQNQNITNNQACKELLDMVRSILNMNGSYCCRCNESLSRTNVKLCNGCGRMAYCSRACQKEDWFNGGHSVTCCNSFTNETAGQFQGRIIPTTPDDQRAATKLRELEINLAMVQLKLFLDNSDTILSQAEGLGVPLCDCVACFDLRACPITVEIAKYTVFHQNSFWRKGFEDSRSEENIMCVYYSESEESPLQMQRMFPHAWLLKQKVTKTK